MLTMYPSLSTNTGQEAMSVSQLDDGQPLAWKAPRTGKTIRSIHTDSSVPFSQLQHYVTPSPHPSPTHTSHPNSHFTARQMIAEALYITRPLAHRESFTPYCTALILLCSCLYEFYNTFSSCHLQQFVN